MIDSINVAKLMKKDVDNLLARFKEEPSLELLIVLQRKTIEAALWHNSKIDSWKISYTLTLFDRSKLDDDLRPAFDAVLDSIQFVRSKSTESWVEQRDRRARVFSEDREVISLLRVLRDKGPLSANKFHSTIAYRGTTRLAYSRALTKNLVRNITMTKDNQEFVGLTHEGRTLLRTLDTLGL